MCIKVHHALPSPSRASWPVEHLPDISSAATDVPVLSETGALHCQGVTVLVFIILFLNVTFCDKAHQISPFFLGSRHGKTHSCLSTGRREKICCSYDLFCEILFWSCNKSTVGIGSLAGRNKLAVSGGCPSAGLC